MFQVLKNRVNQIMAKIRVQNVNQAFLMGMICNSKVNENSIDQLLVVFQVIIDFCNQNEINANTPEQMIFLIYQNLHSDKQQLTPRLSDFGSPTKELYQKPEKIQKSSIYWNEAEEERIEQNGLFQIETEQDDEGTLALIQKIQQEDRLEQLKQKTSLQSDDSTECAICYETLMDSDIHPIDGCDHVYHIQCLRSHVEQAMKEKRIEIPCPDQMCKNKLKEFDIGEVAGKDKQTEYNKYTLDCFVDTHADEMSWCPTPNCGYAFVMGDEQGDSDFQCPLCNIRFCLNCRAIFHLGQSCKEYQITNTKDENDMQFEKFVVGKKFKLCVKCKFWVEKNDGCDHMTCRCGYEFCYKCGGKYNGCDCQSILAKARAEKIQLMNDRKQKRLVAAQLKLDKQDKKVTRPSKRK